MTPRFFSLDRVIVSQIGPTCVRDRSLLALVLPPLLVSTTAEPHSVCERAGCRKLLEDIGLAGNQAEPETGKPFTGFFLLRAAHALIN